MSLWQYAAACGVAIVAVFILEVVDHYVTEAIYRYQTRRKSNV